MKQRLRVGPLSDLQDGEIAAFTVEGHEIAVARVGERVFALEDKCSHEECPLSDGFLDDNCVVCPCHAASFELTTGEPANLPAEKPVRCYSVTIENGDFYITI
jgi:3-phenylpropionate/trans-cinnamate dioxygenase ferredoxin subunit